MPVRFPVWFTRTLPVCVAASFGALLAAANLGAQTVSNFVTSTPCRIADTRPAQHFPAGYGAPSMDAGSTRLFDIVNSACSIPSSATAYSLNITLVPKGPVLYISIWPAGQPQPNVSTLNDLTGAIIANAAVVPAGANGAIALYVDGATDVLIDINGYYTPYVAPAVTQTTIQQITQQITQSATLPTILAQSNSGTQSVAIGNGSSSVGLQNTAIGYNTLKVVSGGQLNTAVGAGAMASNVSGSNNVALGASALQLNAFGNANTAVGTWALFNAFMSGNTAVGFQSLYTDTNGTNNTAVGVNALYDASTGSNNIAIGYNAGNEVNAGSNNIVVGNTGNGNYDNTIYIGTQGVQQNTYIAGIYQGGTGGGSPVYVQADGRLGTFGSALRYKTDITDIAPEANRILDLRPVRFRYKQPAFDGTYPLQYGLIAEEVDEVMPELVERNPFGEIESVKYHLLPALLLQQIQEQQKHITDLERRLAALEQMLQTNPQP